MNEVEEEGEKVRPWSRISGRKERKKQLRVEASASETERGTCSDGARSVLV